MVGGLNGALPELLDLGVVAPTGSTSRGGLSLGAQSASTLSAVVGGAIPARAVLTQLPQDSDTDPFNGPTGTLTEAITVAAGSPLLLADLDRTTSPDLDLYVGRDLDGDAALDQNEVVCQSATAAALERCRISAPAAGNWLVLVQNYQSSTVGASDSLRLVIAALTRTSASNLTVSTPASAAPFTPFTLGIQWTLPASAAPSFAWVELRDGATERGAFALSLTPNDALFQNGFE
jgi:hypothetical protein